MVPFGNASVPSCTLYDCATKLFSYAKKHMYNCIKCCFKPGGYRFTTVILSMVLFIIPSVLSCNITVCGNNFNYGGTK